MWKLYGLVILVAFALCPVTHADFGASLVLINGKIYTVDEDQPIVQAVYIKKGKIAALGTTDKIMRKATPGTRVVELQGRTVVPGFIDSHGHLLNLGMSTMELDLTGTKSYQDVMIRVAEAVKTKKKDEWIIGRGWNQNDWKDQSIPHHYLLSLRSRVNPVMLTRIDGHACLVNATALELAGITKNTPDPPGGRIARDETGSPTGLLVDGAMALVSAVIPELDRATKRRALLEAVRLCTSVGLTTVHDAGVDEDTVELYKELIDADRFNFRVYAMLRARQFGDSGDATDFLKEKPLIGYGQDQLTVRSVKVVSDGALGSRGAALFQPYSDDPGNSGLQITDLATMTMIANRALKQGYQVSTHAIGDLAANAVLTAYASALKQNRNKNHRFRMEHAQVMRQTDIEWMGKLRVIASIQSTHATSDMPWAKDRLGEERIRGAYAWRSMIDAGVRIANGSDFPVESANPLWGFYAAVTRQDHEGSPKDGWYKDQRLSREEALKSFTLDGAYAGFEEDIKGSIEVGKWADLVVLSKNIMTIPAKEILNTRVLMTFVGGTAVYRTGK